MSDTPNSEAFEDSPNMVHSDVESAEPIVNEEIKTTTNRGSMMLVLALAGIGFAGGWSYANQDTWKEALGYSSKSACSTNYATKACCNNDAAMASAEGACGGCPMAAQQAALADGGSACCQEGALAESGSACCQESAALAAAESECCEDAKKTALAAALLAGVNEEETVAEADQTSIPPLPDLTTLTPYETSEESTSEIEETQEKAEPEAKEASVEEQPVQEVSQN